MSDTPRTDAAEMACFVQDVPEAFISFARDLERELNEQVLANGKGSEREAELLGKVGRLERENAALREQLKAADVLQKAAKIKELKQGIHCAMTFGENAKP